MLINDLHAIISAVPANMLILKPQTATPLDSALILYSFLHLELYVSSASSLGSRLELLAVVTPTSQARHTAF